MIRQRDTFLQDQRLAFIVAAMELKDRLKQARKHAKLSQVELAEKVGITQASVSEIERGLTRTSSHLLKIAMVCGVNPTWLLDGSGEMVVQRDKPKESATVIGFISPWDDETPLEDDEVEIPLLKEVRVSGGPGLLPEDLDNGRRIRMGKESLRRQNVQFSNAICVTVSGNSMEPALPDGSTVGVNMHITTIKDGKVYVIKHDGELRVKQVYRLPGGGIRLRSFNRAEHADEDYTPTEMAEKDISILGKVFWSSAFWD